MLVNDPNRIPPDVVARGEFFATYSGWRSCWLRPYSTRRRGERVILYRWQLAITGEVCGGFRSGHSVAWMLSAAQFQDRRFRNVQTVQRLESV